jgi:hypothetical protein
MSLQILLRRIYFDFFSHGCREEDCSRNICPDYYVLDSGDSYSQLPDNVDQAVRLVFPNIFVLVHLSMLIDYFNDRACTQT